MKFIQSMCLDDLNLMVSWKIDPLGRFLAGMVGCWQLTTYYSVSCFSHHVLYTAILTKNPLQSKSRVCGLGYVARDIPRTKVLLGEG